MAKASPFIKTIIIQQDPHDHLRSYSLLGREFILKESEPRTDEGITLDGHLFLDQYWVVSVAEYVRVVPEATNQDLLNSNVIYIPVYVARPSFRPSYIK